MERNRLKCEQYWPLEVDTQETYDHFVVHNTCVNHTSDYRVSTLILQNSKASIMTHFLMMYPKKCI